MGLRSIGPGENVPAEINVVIEIPADSDPVKYEVDKKSGTLYVDRFMVTSMHYPCNYGYIPQTLADDGDPADVLVITPYPLLSGAVVKARPVGVLKMRDECGEDSKILAVPIDKLSLEYRHVQDLEDVPEYLRNSISHFFEHYKDLEPSKWVEIVGWAHRPAAEAEILDAIKNYKPATVA